MNVCRVTLIPLHTFIFYGLSNHDRGEIYIDTRRKREVLLKYTKFIKMKYAYETQRIMDFLGELANSGI